MQLTHEVLAFAVHHSQKHGHVILLKLLDGRGLFLPVYIGALSYRCCQRSTSCPLFACNLHAYIRSELTGDSESNALEKELHQKQSVSGYDSLLTLA